MALLKEVGKGISVYDFIRFHNRNIMALLKDCWIWYIRFLRCGFHNRNIMALLKVYHGDFAGTLKLYCFHNRNIMALLRGKFLFKKGSLGFGFHNRNIMALLKVEQMPCVYMAC